MIKARVDVDFKPLQQLQKNQNRVLRKAIRNTSALLRSDMKQNAPVDTGALKTSIGTRIVTKKKTVLGIVGPRTKYSKTVKGIEKIPNKYAKMQEYKHGFMRATYDANKNRYALTMNQHILDGVQEQLRKQ